MTIVAVLYGLVVVVMSVLDTMAAEAVVFLFLCCLSFFTRIASAKESQARAAASAVVVCAGR